MKTPVIDLFAGAGGFLQAVELSGAESALSVEVDATCCETLSANSPEGAGRVVEADVRELSGQQLRKWAGLKKRDPLIVVGGPPCQPFSKASYWTDPGDDSAYRRKRANGQTAVKPKPITRPKADDRRSLLDEFGRIVRESNADAFVMENVRSLLHPRNKSTFERTVRTFEENGYQCTVAQADASNYGVPQRRQRVFVLGSKHGLPIAPPITHRAKESDPEHLPEALSVGTAISRYRSKKYREEGEEVTGRWAAALREIPPGWNYKYLTEWAGHSNPLFIAETRFWNFLLKLAPDSPSWTINANPGPWVGPFHWDSRRLRTPELAAVQGFRDGYVIVGSRRERVRQVGNAVPPLMASLMIRAVIQTLEG